jgi:hypothetical protein
MIEFGYRPESLKRRENIFVLFSSQIMKPFTTPFSIEDLNHETPVF